MALRYLILPSLVVAFHSAAFGNDMLDLDRVGRQIAAKPCVKPRMTTKLEKNAHDASLQDQFITLRCKDSGSELVRLATRPNRTIPLFASTSGLDQRIPAPFRVGVSPTAIRDRLGVPEVEKTDSITYLLPGETNEERITFIHSGSRVNNIQWSWYFD